MRGIAVRDELTDEWKKRDVKEERDFAILTAETQKVNENNFCAPIKSLLYCAFPKLLLA